MYITALLAVHGTSLFNGFEIKAEGSQLVLTVQEMYLKWDALEEA